MTSLSALPPLAAKRISRFLALLDAQLPKLVEAVWVEGSIALGDFRPHTSDIDLFIVTGRALQDQERRWLRLRGRPSLQVSWSTWDELPRLSSQALGAVTAATLHRHGIALRGPAPAQFVPEVSHALLAEQMLLNVEAYWQRWFESANSQALPRLACLFARAIEWGVAGVPRQYVTLTEGRIVSKTAALQHARERFGSRWHRILDEALRLRAGTPGGHYLNPFVRRREALEFLEHALARTREAARRR